MKIGFIGLGTMGSRMAARLLEAGHSLTVFDTNAAASQPLIARGAEAVPSIEAASRGVDYVFLSLPTPDVVEKVVNTLAVGTAKVVVDLSTTGPDMAARCAAILAKAGIALIDAPVSGGIPGAEAGTLAIMVSGPADAVARVEPALKVLGKLFLLGEGAGAGQAMKVINNMLCAAATVSAFEGVVLGARLGLDPKIMLDVLNASSGRSFATEVKIPQCILDRGFPLRFTTELLEKDVRLCLETAAGLNVPMDIGTKVRGFLQEGIRQGFGKADYAETIKLIEAPAGVRFGN